MTDLEIMSLALKEAKKCEEYGDIPIGAVIVYDGKVICCAHNQKEKNHKTCDHAEILAINKANEILNTNRLDGAIIYTTKEPCLMCMGAILSARIKKIVFGAKDLRFGTKDLATQNNFNHKCEIVGGIMEKECSQIISDFFKKLR